MARKLYNPRLKVKKELAIVCILTDELKGKKSIRKLVAFGSAL